MLRRQSYSKAWLTTVSVDEALRPSRSDRLGGTSWRPAPYQDEPSLAPFATVVREHCLREKALGTVVCLSDLFAARFPHDSPSVDAFDRDFEPASALQRHLAGEPGHCVSRSGLIATALLATGIPARLVQVQWSSPKSIAGGHNAVEFWDDEKGWSLYDPTFGGYFETDEGDRSAVGVALAGHAVRWYQAGSIPAGLSAGRPAVGSLTAAASTVSVVSYVEPWIHTRVGPRVAPRPFNGAFVFVGPDAKAFVLAHWTLMGLILLTATSLGAAFVRLGWLFLWSRRLARVSAASPSSPQSVAARLG